MIKQLSRREKLRYIFLIIMVFVVACLETDMYLPAFPDMMHYFQTTEAMIQSLLSWNFVGICISGPFYGPLSDSFGRKKLLVFAMGLFTLGSFGTVFSGQIEWMLFWRVIQGLGCGGCFTIGTAIVFDKFQNEEATKVINDLNCVIPVIMALAPIIGAYLNIHYGFRSNFAVIALFSSLTFLICLWQLDETLPAPKRSSFQLRRILKDFSRACTCFRFWGPAIIVSCIFSGYLCYISYTSLLFVNDLGVSRALFPVYQGSVLLVFVIASLSANKMIISIGVNRLKKYGMFLWVLGGLEFLLTGCLWPSYYNVFHIGMVLYSFGAGWLISPYFTESMEALPDIKGVTASLVTSFRLLFAAAFVALISACFNNTILPMVKGFLGLYIIVGLTLWLLKNHLAKITGAEEALVSAN